MSESVSKAAERSRESDWEKSRKKTSKVSKLKPKPMDGAGAREEQRRTSVGEGQLNLGSNRNMGRKHESEDAPVHEPQGGFGYTEDQTVRSHSQAPVVEKGAIDNRRTVKSSVTLGRHVQSDPGFKIAERRNVAVVGNRNSTAKQFDDRRKKSSSV